MTNKIKLGKEVVVSDPCYSLPTWCQAVVKNVLPGSYVANATEMDAGDWGNRIAYLTAIHEDYVDQDLSWKRYPAEIGVDSGQAGIFSKETYRVDGIDMDVPTETYDGRPFDLPITEDGDDWYLKMCKITLATLEWGTYENGVVSRSGIGDGGYTLYVARVNRKVVGFIIDFYIDEEGEYRPRGVKGKIHPALHGLF